MILSFTHSSDFVSGGDMLPEHWNEPVAQIEQLFQSRFSSDNFQNESISNSAFRRRGLTEVFRRRNAGDIFTALPFGDPDTVDIPGGAIRFRLRAHADVIVFFTATILRLNHWDKSREKQDGSGPSSLSGGLYPYWHSEIGFQAHWEGGMGEPGREYVQAQSFMEKKGGWVDKVNMSGQVFFAYRIKAKDVGSQVLAPDVNDNYIMTLGYDGVEDIDHEDVRMVDSSFSSVGPINPTVGRLLPGWHNLRHTVHHTNKDWYAQLYYPRSTQEPLVFANTELVVVADYGPRGDQILTELEKASTKPPSDWDPDVPGPGPSAKPRGDDFG